MAISGDILSHLNFQECFDPIIDFQSGRDLIPAMVYGLAKDLFPCILTSVLSSGTFSCFLKFMCLSGGMLGAKNLEGCIVQYSWSSKSQSAISIIEHLASVSF